MHRLIYFLVATFVFTAAWSQNFPNADAEGLELSAKAPDFYGPDQNGNTVQLSELLNEGPVLITFFRGEWCRYCIAQLQDMQDSLGYLLEANINVVAITPAKSTGVRKAADITSATFPLISDSGLKIMHDYKVITEQNFRKYQEELSNGINNQHKYLPVPAAYLISQTGEVIYRYFDPNYRVRPSVKAIINAL